ncbi:MAG: nucleotidyltransferase family protein [Pseudomonadales bacterium]
MSTFPDHIQSLLLKAALLDGSEAQEAITTWADRVDLNEIDWASQRLVPLLFENIRRLGMTPQYFDLLKGVHRYWWFRNSRNMGRLKTVASGLKKAGVKDIMLLKGCALANFYYSDVALRPMSDIDILVRPADAVTAMKALKHLGFTVPNSYEGQLDAETVYRLMSRLGFSHPEYGDVDLHWEMLPVHSGRQFDNNVWQNAVEQELDGEDYYIPCAPDLLLHAILHGLRNNVMLPIWWVADAQAIMQGEPKMDWQYFFSQVTLAKRAGIVNEAFEWLEATLPSAALQNMPQAPEDRRYSLSRRYLGSTSRVFRFQELRREFAGYCDRSGVARTPSRFMQYLQLKWELASYRELPARALQSWRL